MRRLKIGCCAHTPLCNCNYIHLTKTTAAQDEAALSYHKVRGLYIPTVVFAVIIPYDACYRPRHGVNPTFTLTRHISSLWTLYTHVLHTC